jgi:hypothetical protein
VGAGAAGSQPIQAIVNAFLGCGEGTAVIKDMIKIRHETATSRITPKTAAARTARAA